jgi:hypothetical protein
MTDGYLLFAEEITGEFPPFEAPYKLGLLNDLPTSVKVGSELMTGLLGYPFDQDGKNYDPSF